MKQSFYCMVDSNLAYNFILLLKYTLKYNKMQHVERIMSANSITGYIHPFAYRISKKILLARSQDDSSS